MCYIYVCFQFVAFIREHMWHNALLMGYLMRLELTLVSCININYIYIYIYIYIYTHTHTLAGHASKYV